MKKLTVEFDDVFSSLPANYLLLLPNNPDYTIVACSNSYAKATGSHKSMLIGKKLFDAFPDNPEDKDINGVEKLARSLQKVIATKETDTMTLTHYDVPGKSGDFMEKFWNPVNTPVISNTGELAYIIHSAEDTTEKLKKIQGGDISKGFGEEQRRRYKKTILRAPIAVAILTGPKFIIESVNDKMCRHWGRKREQLIDRPLHEAIPESRTDEFERMLREIFISGEGYTSNNENVTLIRDGKELVVSVDFVCEPLFDDRDNVESILVMAYEKSIEDIK